MEQAFKFDGGKPRTDLLPVKPLLEIARVLEFEAEKYGERHWEAGMDWERPYAATLRHLFAWQGGETADPETGLNHLAHAACELLFLLEYAATGAGTDNRPLQHSPDENITMGDLYAKYCDKEWDGEPCLACALDKFIPNLSNYLCGALPCDECANVLLKDFKKMPSM